MKLKIAKNELDFAQKSTLNRDFWQNKKLNPKVGKVILTIVKNYLKSTNLRLSIDNIDEIEFTGSLANYSYNKFSDVDIHLLFDFSELGNDPDFMRELLTAKAINWNNRHNITIFGHEVELYITDAKSSHHSTGVYSIKDDKWLVEPVKDTKLSAELNLNKIKDKADKISKQIDMLAVKDNVSLEKIESLKDKIKKMRESGLETGGEHSTENLAFKLLRRRGELNTLYALMNQAQDLELSLDEDTEWWKKKRKSDNKNYRELMGYVSGKGTFKRKYAAKNTGYPKSVSRKKLSKLGAPYMMDPPRRLPKSAPPGVAESLLKEYTDDVQKAAAGIKETLDNGELFSLNLNQRAFGQFKCLEEHTYEIKKEGEKYNLKLKDAVGNITTEVAKKYQKAGRINPISRCVYYSGEALITSEALDFILLSELSQGNVKDILSVPSPSATPTPKKKPMKVPAIAKAKSVPATSPTPSAISKSNKEPEKGAKEVKPKASKHGLDTKDIIVDLKPLGGLRETTKGILNKSAKIIGVIENSKKVSFKVSSLKRNEGIHGEGKAVDFKFIINGTTVSNTDTYAYLISLMAEGLIPDVSLGAYTGKYNAQTMKWTDNVHIDSRPKRAWFWFEKCKEGRGNQEKCNGVSFNGGPTRISGSKQYSKRDTNGKHKTSGTGLPKSKIIDNNVMRFPAELINRIKEIRTKVQKYKQTVQNGDTVV
tara:strand:+ start:3304 stop:5427 length:2124 start_codon:yes stop_codon:yes gene_type:complete